MVGRIVLPYKQRELIAALLAADGEEVTLRVRWRRLTEAVEGRLDARDVANGHVRMVGAITSVNGPVPDRSGVLRITIRDIRWLTIGDDRLGPF